MVSMEENTVSQDIIHLLDTEAERINSHDFIASDPVQFPRRFSALPDIEIAAMLSSMIAWGNRKMICRDCDRMLSMMADDPAAFTLEGGYEEIPDEINIHRTFFGRDLKYFLRGMRRIIGEHGSLDAFASAIGAGNDEAPAWKLAEAMLGVLREENGGKEDSRCLPVNLKATALKRLNMALRWLVRDDGIVDMGVWCSIRPSQLFIPLDVHVGRISRELGLLTRRSNDRKAVEELTARLRTICPDDPCRYDYALFGIGVEGRVPLRADSV